MVWSEVSQDQWPHGTRKLAESIHVGNLYGVSNQVNFRVTSLLLTDDPEALTRSLERKRALLSSEGYTVFYERIGRTPKSYQLGRDFFVPEHMFMFEAQKDRGPYFFELFD